MHIVLLAKCPAGLPEILRGPFALKERSSDLLLCDAAVMPTPLIRRIHERLATPSNTALARQNIAKDYLPFPRGSQLQGS